jgi:hypothetical protein
MGEIYELPLKTGSGAMIYIASSTKTGSGIQKLIEGRSTDIQTAWR